MKKWSRIVSLGLAAGMVMATLSACGGNGGAQSSSAGSSESSSTSSSESSSESSSASAGQSDSGAVWKIGGIGPISGPAADYGLNTQYGAQVAVDEINAAGGIAGYQIEFNFQDDEHNATKSINAYNSLKDWGMQILMGTVTSAPCQQVVVESSADNMFQLTPSATSVEAIEPDNAFRVCFSDPNQGVASAQYISDNHLGTAIAILYNSDDVYSTGIFEKFSETAAKSNLNVVASASFTDKTNTDFKVQLQQFKDAGADLLFMPFYYSEASVVLTQANEMGYAPIFFGVDGMDGILSVENFDTSLAEGLMLLTPFAADAQDDLTQKFVKAYQDAHGAVPSQFAADGYDAIFIIKEAIEKSGVTPDMSVSEIGDALKSAMTTLSVDGLTGSGITWDASGEPSKEPKAVIIENGAYKAL